MLSKLLIDLERLVAAYERHAAATERIAAVAEKREYSLAKERETAPVSATPTPPTEPAENVSEEPQTWAVVPEELQKAKALLEETKWNPFETPVNEVRYQAKMTKLLRTLLDNRAIGYPAKTKGADLHLMVLDAYPELALKATDNEQATPPEDATDITAFGEFKSRLVEFVGADTERRAQLNECIKAFGAEKASDIPAEKRTEFLAKLEGA